MSEFLDLAKEMQQYFEAMDDASRVYIILQFAAIVGVRGGKEAITKVIEALGGKEGIDKYRFTFPDGSYIFKPEENYFEN